MKNKGKCLLVTWSVIILVTIFSVTAAIAGSVCLTVTVDGICKNVFNSKEAVYLNTYAGFGPPGEYFFVVLAPGGVSNPNDQGGYPDLNLSDDGDSYSNRSFNTSGGSLSYTNTHIVSEKGPYIQLSPYTDTPIDSIYIIAVCYLGASGSEYPVQPQDCSYNAFRIKNK